MELSAGGAWISRGWKGQRYSPVRDTSLGESWGRRAARADPLLGFDLFSQGQEQSVPSIDYDSRSDCEFNLGVVIGITHKHRSSAHQNFDGEGWQSIIAPAALPD